MKKVLKIKLCVLLFVFLTMLTGSITATDIVTPPYPPYEYVRTGAVCYVCGSNEWLTAHDEYGHPYHGICPDCKYEMSY